MIIISGTKDLIINCEKLVSCNIHTEGLRIMVTVQSSLKQSHCIGEYKSKEDCKRAFGLLIDAFEREAGSYRMPEKNDQIFNTQLRTSGGGFRVTQTNGKTK